MIHEKISRDRVNGFLHAAGTTIQNGRNEEILLTGWGLGNWLNPEGYMWQSDVVSFSRGREAEKSIRELAGEEYARFFWEQFRANYITKKDIEKMAELGYNSVRIPINWRLFMEETPGEIIWKEEGFTLLDNCIRWCREFRIYAWIDLHAAPGGQTGSNIDDTADDLPRLFMCDDYYEKGIALWGELAKRYKDDWIVGGYDLLNEPIMPNDGYTFDQYIPKLKQFYHDVIREIRKVDTRHMVSLEGEHWSTETTIFDEHYDDNMVLHFHRYACYPEQDSIQRFLDCSTKQNIPLWLGETGENKIDWYAAYYPMILSYGIGYNLWTWKKMVNRTSPLSVRKPDGWERIVSWMPGKVHPSKEEVQRCLNEYLNNIRIENCDINEDVVDYAFRRQPASVRAQDFELFDSEEGKSLYFGHSDNRGCIYRKDIPISLKEICEPQEKVLSFDCLWDRYVLQLHKEEMVSYRFFDLKDEAVLTICGVTNPNALMVFQDGRLVRMSVKEEAAGEKAQTAGCILTGRLVASAESFIVLKAEDEIEAERISVG